MTGTPFRPTRIAAAFQTASLLAVAAAVFGILISDMTQRGAGLASPEAPRPHAQLFALPH
jgi:hypothetical protein